MMAQGHFVEMPCGARLATRRFGAPGESGAELLISAANRFVTDAYTALEQ
jgi:hypothetical protein